MCTLHRAARHGRHATPGYAMPCHAASRDPSYVARGARWRWCWLRYYHRCLYRECTHVRVRIYHRKDSYKTFSDAYTARIYLCRLARLIDEIPEECQKLHRPFIVIKKIKTSILRMPLQIQNYFIANRYLTCNQIHYRSFVSFQVFTSISRLISNRGTYRSLMANEYKRSGANAVLDS